MNKDTSGATICSISMADTLNSQFRTRAKNDFGKNLYKLMNNAVFGKIMENVRNHVDVKLITKWDGRYDTEAMIAKSNFHSRQRLCGESNRLRNAQTQGEIQQTDLRVMGLCIFDISKVYLYEFHHEYMSLIATNVRSCTPTQTVSFII